MEYNLKHYHQVDSTSSTAQQLVAEGVACGTVVYADVQTAGRGRQGRKWNSVEGNLMCSVILKRPELLASLSVLPYLIGLAVHDSVAKYVHYDPVQLKWPNDVLVGGKKIAGVLIEKDSNSDAVVVGIGLNIAVAPKVPDYPTCALAHFIPLPPSRDQMLKAALDGIGKYIAVFNKIGPREIYNMWNQQAYKLGQEISIKSGGHAYTGIFKGVNNSGELVMEGAKGEQLFSSVDQIM